MSCDDETGAAGQDQAAPDARHCPRCGAEMGVYARSAMFRCAGLVLLYAAALALLLALPEPSRAALVLAALLAACGAVMIRRDERWLCPECGYRGSAAK